jgi:hypothetical protein
MAKLRTSSARLTRQRHLVQQLAGDPLGLGAQPLDPAHRERLGDHPPQPGVLGRVEVGQDGTGPLRMQPGHVPHHGLRQAEPRITMGRAYVVSRRAAGTAVWSR